MALFNGGFMRHYRPFVLFYFCISCIVELAFSKVPLPAGFSFNTVSESPGDNSRKIRAIPPAPVRNIAEFEPMEASLIRYPLNFPVDMVKDLAEDAIVYVYCGSSQQTQANQAFTNAGVKMANIKYIHLQSADFWPRDHGPWYITDGENKIGIIDFVYEENWNAPEVDTMPWLIAGIMNLSVFKMTNIKTAGGNYMCDGWGNAVSSDKIQKNNPSLTLAQIKTTFKDYCGIETYHSLKDPNGDDINLDHVDCWAKFLTPDKIMIRQTPATDADYKALEDIVTYFKGLKSAYGTPYKIFRVTSTGKTQAYTNSLIFNNRVLVPFSSASNDAPALEAYKNAMPGYIVKGYTYTGWKNYDALHCRVMGLADKGMLYIKHIPLHDTIADTGKGILLSAALIPYSGQELIADSCAVYYKRKDDAAFKSAPLSVTTGNTYTATIPCQFADSFIHYYIHAADKSGRSENHPYIGAPDPHVFYYDYKGTAISTNHIPQKQSALCTHYADPFMRRVYISWKIPFIAHDASLYLYSTTGRSIRRWNITTTAGSVAWDPTIAGPGVYIYSLRNGTTRVSGIMQVTPEL